MKTASPPTWLPFVPPPAAQHSKLTTSAGYYTPCFSLPLTAIPFFQILFLFFQSRLSIQQLKRTPLASVLNLANMTWNVEAHLIWIPEEKYSVPGNRAVPQVGWRDLLLRARRASIRDRDELFCTSPTSPTHYFPSLLFYTFLLYSVQKSFAYFKYSTDFSHLSILHISCLEPILLSTYRLMY